MYKGYVSPLRSASLAELAEVIRADWGADIDAYAAAYLRGFDSLDDKSGYEAHAQMLYVLNNTRRWCGATARSTKAELRRRFENYWPRPTPQL